MSHEPYMGKIGCIEYILDGLQEGLYIFFLLKCAHMEVSFEQLVLE